MADAELLAHREWLGYVQPVGVVVSPPALVAGQAYVNRNVAPLQELLLDIVEDPASGPSVSDLPKLLCHVLRWQPEDVVQPVPEELERVLPEYGEVLRPTHAVREVELEDGANPWVLLTQMLAVGTDLDTPHADSDRGWHASPSAKFERLLRETQVPIGLLANGTHLRLVYAPRGETSGYITFPVAAMTEVAGRPMLAALDMLLGAERLFALPRAQRLPALLLESRRYQNEVSTRLAGQVLAALYELLRGFQAADDHARGALLRDVLRSEPDHVYEGLLTVLLRLVFLLYAEDRDLMPSDDVYTANYSIGGLFDRLRADAGRYPDTMDLRYGAWAQLLSVFRMVHDGASYGPLRLPPRQGHLFNPDRFPFLEGRPHALPRVMGDRAQVPLVSDGVVWRVLQNLLVLDSERLSYRSLDVEQIGSVYETMMGFRLEIARGHSMAIRPAKPHGAPVTVNLDELLEIAPTKRARWIRERTDRKLTDKEAVAIARASSIEEAITALERKVDRRATPNVVPPQAMVLQPSEERRRTGSHYTPRSLTEPIVRTTLRPILETLGANPSPDAILNLKVCDPAMGSGAFLVEVCRQLADALVDAWHSHKSVPSIPSDSDELLHARRLVAQRCLYGVDRNPIAVDLGKLSLWLATLARDHAFMFLDQSIRCGDSLVGLTRDQIAAFHWEPKVQQQFLRTFIAERITAAAKLRADIQDAADGASDDSLRFLLNDADETLNDVRIIGDLVVDAFFSHATTRDRREARDALADILHAWLTDQRGEEELRVRIEDLRDGRGVIPFHWEIEFPEVFGRDNPGFDALVGNPPFAGKNTLIDANPERYPDWLKQLHEQSHGNADLVAHFFRRGYGLLRDGGCFGLIATNTIGQGDTRSTGLRWICTHGGTIYAARERVRWPVPAAAVVVSIVHTHRGALRPPFDLDGRPVDLITAYLFHAGGHEDPARLRANAGRSFIGTTVLGMGFTFDDTDTTGVASSLAMMRQLIENNPGNAARIVPYIGGEEVNVSPTHAHHRYIINFEDMTEAEARRWPDLMTIVEERVRPERDGNKRETRRRYWWRFGERAPKLYEAIRGLDRVIVTSRMTKNFGFAILPNGSVFSENTVVFPLASAAALALLQSRVHEVWARFFSATLEDRLHYTPTDCFETFPLPLGFETDPSLESAGREYYAFRTRLMIQNGEGLTKTYNRFDDPFEKSPDVLQLRELHDVLDRKVLDVYGWSNVQPACEFILAYEDEEDNDNGSKRRKPWRYRWADGIRDEVLARLLELNEERAEAERLEAIPEASRRRGRRSRVATLSPDQLLLEEN